MLQVQQAIGVKRDIGKTEAIPTTDRMADMGYHRNHEHDYGEPGGDIFQHAGT